MESEQDKNRYLVVANLVTKYDKELGELFNMRSGLSDAAFQVVVSDFAERHNLRILLQRDNTAILVATEKYKEDFIFENPRFSAQFCNENQVCKVIDAVYDSDIMNKIFGSFQIPRTSIAEYEAPLDA